MTVPKLRYYVAASLDGYIATPSGGVEWLHAFDPDTYGYADFFDEIGTLILGRRTFDQVVGFGAWPYGKKRCLVLTARPLEPPVPSVKAWSGDVADLVRDLKRLDGDIWLVGGTTAAQPFIEQDLVDRYEIHALPVMIGNGVRLFDPVETDQVRRLTLMSCRTFSDGVVKIVYDRLAPSKA